VNKSRYNGYTHKRRPLQALTQTAIWYLEFFLHELVKLRHPAEGEMAVGEEHPVALCSGNES